MIECKSCGRECESELTLCPYCNAELKLNESHCLNEVMEDDSVSNPINE